jgi:SAM-dependent methyltransferase
MSSPEAVAGLAARWREALESWAIPDEILAAAPAPPWVHPPQMFRLVDGDAVPETPSFRQARAALGAGGTVLDVGCGGGRSSLPLGGVVTHVTGVDESGAMLAQFASAAAARGIPAVTVQGRWPDVAASVGMVDLVVCHHVAYNVADIVPFIEALTAHARRRIVVELTARHPQSALSPLWKHFWGIERPTEPSSRLFADIVRALGHEPEVDHEVRTPRRSNLDPAAVVAFVRQRLCLPADRDGEVEAALGADPRLGADDYTTVAWDPIISS